jgi:hypothetical protein
MAKQGIYNPRNPEQHICNSELISDLQPGIVPSLFCATMISTRLVLVLPLYALGFLQTVIAWPSVEPLAARVSPGPLDSWLTTETSTALQGVLDNIGSGGANTAGVSSGFVIASPSKSNPDCKRAHRVEELS